MWQLRDRELHRGPRTAARRTASPHARDSRSASAIPSDRRDESSTHLVVVPDGGPYDGARVEVELVDDDGWLPGRRARSARARRAVSSSRAGTYSIVARDPATGELGVAVQSHWFSVGSIVTWARAGVGAVATQSIAEPAYGPRLLERLGAGEEPGAALAEELAPDPLARFRQVAVVDGRGPGRRSHRATAASRSPVTSRATGFSAQANMMASAEVWPAMAARLRERRRARSIAACSPRSTRPRPRAGTCAAPVRGAARRPGARASRGARTSTCASRTRPTRSPSCARLLDLHDAYALADRADTLAGEGRHDEAAALYAGAAAAAPASAELAFWAGLGIAATGDLDVGRRTRSRGDRREPRPRRAARSAWSRRSRRAPRAVRERLGGS